MSESEDEHGGLSAAQVMGSIAATMALTKLIRQMIDGAMAIEKIAQLSDANLTHLNGPKLREAGLRLIDTLEMILEAAMHDENDEQLRAMHNAVVAELNEVRASLSKVSP